MQYPKDFALIASFLPHKTPQDCVSFYYLSKPAAEFKQKLKAQSVALRRRSARNGWALAVQAFEAVGSVHVFADGRCVFFLRCLFLPSRLHRCLPTRPSQSHNCCILSLPSCCCFPPVPLPSFVPSWTCALLILEQRVRAPSHQRRHSDG